MPDGNAAVVEGVWGETVYTARGSSSCYWSWRIPSENVRVHHVLQMNICQDSASFYSLMNGLWRFASYIPCRESVNSIIFLRCSRFGCCPLSDGTRGRVRSVRVMPRRFLRFSSKKQINLERITTRVATLNKAKVDRDAPTLFCSFGCGKLPERL